MGCKRSEKGLKCVREKTQNVLIMLSVFLLLTVVVFVPNAAFSANRDYLSEAKWIDNPNVSQQSFSKSAMSNTFTLKGTVKYYFDSTNNVFYVYFIFNESSITRDENNVAVCYDISNSNEAYHISVSKDGYSCDDDPDKDYFAAQYDFQNNGSNQQICVVALEVKGSSTNYADVYLNVNGHNYKNILKQIELKPSKTIRTTGAKNTKTSNGKAKENKKQTKTSAANKYSTKFSGGVVIQTTKAQAQQQTNAQGNTQQQASAQPEQGSSGDEYVLSAEEDYSNKDGGTISKDAKIMIIAACITAAVGALFIISGMLKKDKQSSLKKSATSADDKNPDENNDDEINDENDEK